MAVVILRRGMVFMTFFIQAFVRRPSSHFLFKRNEAFLCISTTTMSSKERERVWHDYSTANEQAKQDLDASRARSRHVPVFSPRQSSSSAEFQPVSPDIVAYPPAVRSITRSCYPVRRRAPARNPACPPVASC